MNPISKKIDFIVGARPNFMKVSAILKANNNHFESRLIHTGQHYDKNMSQSFFDDLDIPRPDVNLKAEALSSVGLIADVMNKYQAYIDETYSPDIILVVGDVDSTVACSIVSKRNNIKLCHVEGGLRSGDLSMPEEINRILTDSITDYFFVTSEHAIKNLLSEGKEQNVFFVGNTMIDTLINNLSKLRKPDTSITDDFYLLTMHRPANVDQNQYLTRSLETISENLNSKILFPVHPRTKKNIGTKKFKNITFLDPLPYLEFIYLLKNCKGVITDSGGITEEATFLNIPCITLRDNTERPETIEVGSNVLVGSKQELLIDNLEKIEKGNWKKSSIPEKWDGKTGERIVNILKDL